MEISFQGMRFAVPRQVYLPAEDSLMLAKAAGSLRGSALEIGCGCGIASLACAKARASNRVLGTDITQAAVSCSTSNARRNSITNVRFIRSDLFSSVPKKRFDAIIFNPPYLPTEYNEKLSGALNLAFDGGKDGRKVLDVFLQRFDDYLRPGGTLLLVQSSLNGPLKTRKKLESLGYAVGVADKQDFFFESVTIVKAVKTAPLNPGSRR